jgi:hypothetical protein
VVPLFSQRKIVKGHTNSPRQCNTAFHFRKRLSLLVILYKVHPLPSQEMEEAVITARRELLHEGKSGTAEYNLVPFISYQILVHVL